MKLSVKKLSESKGHRSPIYALCYYKENEVLTGGGEGWIAEWDLSNPGDGKLLASVPTSVFSLYYIKFNDLIVAGDRDGGLHWIDKEGKSNDVFAHHKGVYGICKMENYIYTLGGDGFLSKWDIDTQKPLESIQLSATSLRSFSIDDHNTMLYVGSSDGIIHSVDLKKMELIFSVKVHDGSVFSLKYLSNKSLLSGGKDALIKLIKEFPGQADISINAHWFAVYSLVVHPSGLFFASASRDKSIRLWTLPEIKPITTIDYSNHQGHIRSVNNLLWSEDGSKLISVSDDTTMIIWQIEIVD